MQNREMYCDKAPGVLYRSLRIYNENSKWKEKEIDLV